MSATPISRYPVPALAELPEDIRARILDVQEKAGFVPNVFLTLAHRPAEFRAFFAYHDALMLKEGGLTKAEREMIVVAEHDGVIIGCAALYAFPEEKVGELAALAVHPDFRREGYGEALMQEIESRARKMKLDRLFVLTTRASQWFLERGYHTAAIADLPRQKQALYNYQRKSQVYRKVL